MEAIKKQATKLREQVAKQQQAVLRHLGKEGVSLDDKELQCHKKLQNLYNSTRAAKHFQRDIVRGVEGFISVSRKQMEIARKLAEDCCKYGNENQYASSPLARASLHFGTSSNSVEDQRENMFGILHEQVCEPLRDSTTRAPLEDARHLTHNYNRLCREVEVQATEIVRRQAKCRHISVESVVKLKNAEERLTELKSSMVALGKEATDAMLSVEDQQQRDTFQNLLTMVGVERSYHQNALSILEELHAEMIPELQAQLSSSQSETLGKDVDVPSEPEDSISESKGCGDENQDDTHFIAKVVHSFDAQTDGELSLSIDDYIVVHQVAPHGWSEGECMGKSGWFPSAYVQREDKAPSSKLINPNSSP
ncbi:hypothetical protein LguiA_033694 [Lonicera macranthoides]